jgi:glycosyltransferase involved in cell wall biosynthesis
MNKITYILTFIAISFANLYSVDKKPEKPIVILTPSYNNAKWFETYINSILIQDYKKYRIIYLDDKSTDGMGDTIEKYLVTHGIDHSIIHFDDSFSTDTNTIVEEFIKQVNSDKHFFTFVRNVNRCGALENIYRAVYSCEENEIVATIDGDDCLAPRRDVLKQLNKVYSSGKIWFTHGTLMEYPSGNVTWNEPISPIYIQYNAIRDFKCPSHLRTFYAWIFKKIKLEDFLYEGKFLSMAWDMAIMFPIAEMSGKRHAFIKEVNYYYNMANPINDNKVNADLQNKLDQYIRKKERYKPLP